MNTDVTIFEGPDGAGKTTLVDAWTVEGLLVDAVHLGPHKGDPRRELMAHLAAHPGPVAFDRFHLGEQVYGPVYRGKDGLGWIGRRAVEKALAKRCGIVVICLPAYAVAHANWARRRAEGGEMFPSPSGFKSVYDRYLTVKTDLPVVMYDYTLQSVDRACVAIHDARMKAYPIIEARAA